ncbi:hypothetical protein [Aureispira sp. CCB-E]|uniref:hypothetical protein n=1 Tax=Aureispira sp. CCB-E TaxID=3051121 RepID=UPI0028690AA7|nr:hypothetical protein [Aureispira sp. CCB-E]WMX12970.1 hypothetical protein QP953_19210 [Aureispira sp. CCB-E]
MRKTSSQIHTLIRSLSKEEKRKVTMHLRGLGKKGIKHLKLFKAIDKQEIYDEETLKKAFRGTSFSIEKKRLYDLVREVLIVFHGQVDTSQEILAGLQYFRILVHKELYKAAEKEIYKLKKIAEEQQLFLYVQLIDQEILKLENKVLQFYSFKDDSFTEFIDAIQTNSLLANNLYHYNLLKTQLHYLYRKKTRIPKDLLLAEQLIQHPILASPTQAHSALAQLEYHQIHLIYDALKGNLENALEHSIESLSIFEAELINIRPPEEYISHLYNLASRALFYRKIDLILSLIAKIEKSQYALKTQHPIEQLRLIELKANIYAITGNTQEGLKLIAEQSDWLEKTPLDVLVPYSCFVSIYFVVPDYEKALFYIEKILDKKQNKSYLALQLNANITKLLIYFETQEDSLLESALRSLHRQLYPHKENYNLELRIIRFLKKILSTKKNEHPILFQEMYEELSTLFNHTPNNKITQLSMIRSWLKSKIQGCSLALILQQHNSHVL